MAERRPGVVLIEIPISDEIEVKTIAGKADVRGQGVGMGLGVETGVKPICSPLDRQRTQKPIHGCIIDLLRITLRLEEPQGS
ncbi:hypothetical protein [Rhizobium ruizarguesonis]|uniref:hypothetical protein n=1 Tax=Rhizobium ruizarguesonis TaxID=2081791 RepID=UPI001FDF37FB|nr:hypothetical protein [Rhizobium ruizarguesonis]